MVRLIARDLMIDRPAAPSRVLALFRNDTSVVHTPFHRRTKTVGRISTRIVLRERKKKKKKIIPSRVFVIRENNYRVTGGGGWTFRTRTTRTRHRRFEHVTTTRHVARYRFKHGNNRTDNSIPTAGSVLAPTIRIVCTRDDEDDGIARRLSNIRNRGGGGASAF